MIQKLLHVSLYIALRRRKLVFFLSLFLTLVSLYLCSFLKLNMQWTNLLPDSNPVVKQYIRATEDYTLGSNYIITVKADSIEKIEKTIDLIIPKLESLENVVSYTYGKSPEDFFMKHGLRMSKPKDVKRAAKIFSDLRLVSYMKHLNDDFEKEFSGNAEEVKKQERELVRNLSAIEEFLKIISEASKNGTYEASHFERVLRDLTSGNPYQISLDKKMGIIMVAVNVSVFDSGGILIADKKITDALEELQPFLNGADVGTAGLIPLSRDEMESIGPYTMVLFLIAMIFVFFALSWNYRSAIVPLLSLVPLITGIIWSMGFFTLTVKELNIFTAMIMLVLVGLGIDFAIHVVTRFYEERGAGRSLEKALENSIIYTGNGVVTGALTTAMAFFALMVAGTKGIREFGFCAGSGVIITLIALFMILPSLLAYRDEKFFGKEKKFYSRNFDGLGTFSQKISGGRHVSLLILTFLIVFALVLTKSVGYEYDMLELEPKGLASIELQEEILDRYKLSTEMAFVTTDSVEASRSLRKKLEKKSVVGEVSSIDLLIPSSDWVAENDETIRNLRSHLNNAAPVASFTGNDAVKYQEKFKQELQRLLYNMIEIEELSFIGGQDRMVSAFEQLTGGEEQNGMLVKLVDSFNRGDQINWQAMTTFSNDFYAHMRERMLKMTEHLGPVTEDMLPEKYIHLYKNQDSGRYLVQIYPRKDLYEREDLERFNASVSTVSSEVSGMPRLIILINDEMVNDGMKALVASAIIIFLLLIFDLKNIFAAFLAAVPLFFGALWMLATMSILGIKLNFVNIIAIPIIIGIGVDDGIHIVHRWRQEGRGGLKKATAKVGHAILLTSITTMIGFGSVAFYTHRGMASLGQVLFLGVGFCFLSTIMVFPLIGTYLEEKILSVPDKTEKAVEFETS